MPGIAELALGAAPLAGGALLGVAAGNLKAPDVRALITKDMDLLARIPADQTERRARFQETIDERIDGLIEASDKGKALRDAALSYKGNWRDIVVFLCAVLFTFIWWNVSHARANWLITFIAMIVLTVLAAWYASRGAVRAVRSYLHNKEDPDQE